jgi:chromosome segregation ATPase
MTGGFNANVPARKPRTRIGQVLTELTSEPDAGAVDSGERTPSPMPETTNGADVAPAVETRAAADPEVAETAVAAPEPNAPRIPPKERAGREQDASRLAAGRDRVASLRERLAHAARAPVAATEPKRAAAAVLEVIDDLRARLAKAMAERVEMADALEDTRAELARARSDIEKERKVRTAVEARAEERAKIAADAVAEAEALASERDQVLSELAEQRRLDDEQAALLAEAEAVLERRDEERQAAAEERAELRDALEARAVQLSEMDSRLDAAAADYARLEARCQELEGQVTALTEAREALESLEATVNRPGS